MGHLLYRRNIFRTL